MSGRIEFGIVGGGWRAEFFLRVAQALPERFHVAGMMVRDAAKGAAIEAKWGVKTCRDMDAFLKGGRHPFAVVSVPSEAAKGIVPELLSHGVPVLMETPPAWTVEGLEEFYKLASKPGGKVQVAEQYAFQPLHAARLNLVKSGRLGKVSQAQVSVAHDYHGISLIRRFLGVGFEDACVRGFEFKSPIVEGRGRNGGPDKERIASSGQKFGSLDFGGKLGIYDFTGDQYFSWIRSPRVLIRGERGEVNNCDIRHLLDFKTPIQTEFMRQEAGQDGNLEGLYLKGICAGGEWLYVNPFAPGRLSDDEIAVATCLAKMQGYVDGGPAFYSLAEACQDTYLGLMVGKAAASGETLKTQRQAWCSEG